MERVTGGVPVQAVDRGGRQPTTGGELRQLPQRVGVEAAELDPRPRRLDQSDQAQRKGVDPVRP